ncbi:endonuclease/exonuclease/phosphatase family protein [Roseibacterium sp. SDUM158017]|uniref:endonuclease/exonuclease/phosphatase family protein n=1 Tax=Roseicyclus salinarum TaxID=3036773 RepID=UPI002414F822|nr:endonuclease/exonuclease/phosphatase family protein [Roseibacterium sp. SDUM158017]MDG4649427.1 endonuclease/exonuclease/phosphatase family protein [Roseibacterium sp. SDUM158017]
MSGDDPQVLAARDVIVAARADVLLLLDMDHDVGLAALQALAGALAEAGLDYPHRFAAAPNTGRPTGIDLDGDGRSYRARDAQGYGLFRGDGGMALLSRHPVGAVRDFTDLPWVALPEASAAEVTPPEALDVLALHSVGAWDVEILAPGGPVHLLGSHASPPVFDGPEDRNGRRNADELRFWTLYLDGWTPGGAPFTAARFAVAGTFNVDPSRGEGRRDSLRALLGHPALRDAVPAGASGSPATADWQDPWPGDLRVDYILPSRTMRVLASGVLWPSDGGTLMGVSPATAAAASDHRLVWMDLSLADGATTRP